MLIGCAHARSSPRAAPLLKAADAYSFTKKTVATHGFEILTLYRITDSAKPAYVYIEGDGFAWKKRNLPSLDPTPKDPLVIRLAGEDDFSNVIYLARPCQYTGPGNNPRWDSRYWTGDRFSKTVIETLNAVLDEYTKKGLFSGVYLVGYSGGGAVAVLLATERTDVRGIVTLAADLDHRWSSAQHHVSRLQDSENPIDYADRVRLVPQIHLAGGKDRVIHPEVSLRFMGALGHPATARRVLCPKCTHQAGWNDAWPQVRREFRDPRTGQIRATEDPGTSR